ncbi:MAG: hypothetical protein KKA32_02975 [Actinobacteria bacterium]|nr:hypothetical protein [Actinomycetota bacterium]
MVVSDFPERDQVSHVMATTLTGADGTTQVANFSSATCRSCHGWESPSDESRAAGG